MPPTYAEQLRAWLLRPLMHRFNDLGDAMAVTQADLDAVVGNLRSLRSELTDADSRIQTALDALAAANPNLDLSEVQAALTDLDTTVANTVAIVPAAPGDGGGVQDPTDPGAGTGDGGSVEG